MTVNMPFSAQPFEEQIKNALIKDQYYLSRELAKLKAHYNEQGFKQWSERLQLSCQQVLLRQQSVPRVHYDEALPIALKREEIKKALLSHQVVIIGGETGSGKTTQLPKLCLEIGRGTKGMIGHTQPRRIAARTVANRIAEELGCSANGLVGYQVRFEDNSTAQTLIKLMTDGILLTETQHDRFLNRYDTLIIDEAHERSLNIDFLLGFLKMLLPKRPDLKVIITSATIDLARFSDYFNQAPIIEVSGRTYPVDTWYRPLVSQVDEEGNRVEDDLSIDQGILAAIGELEKYEREHSRSMGDILIFLSGEREIRDVADILRKSHLKHTTILPLYASLTPKEQQKIFQPQTGRKVVLATNVAETSLTVPGIRYVIDTGLARVSRYSYRAKIQRLPIEPVSQASANQRKGRCGRVEAGVCVRLYSEEDFLSRPLFTDPEILRTNLASVILQMLHLRLGKIEAFPFIEEPETKAIKDGFTLLHELSAVTVKGELTLLGQQLARLPIDPRLGRMIVEGAKRQVLQSILIIAAALSIQDPRERPLDKQQAADQAHAKWLDTDSDFAALVNLWRAFEEQRQALGSGALRQWCRRHFLNYLRLREWREAHRQLLVICKELRLSFQSDDIAAVGYDAVHQSILSGLLSHAGQKTEDNDYLGARQRRFWIHPSTGVAKKRPQWLMAAELVETSKLFARVVAKIQPEWLELLGQHLVKRSYNEPHWEKKRGQVVAYEQVTLYGLIIVGRRAVHYGPHDAKLAREIFIREALVGGEILSKAQCLAANRSLLDTLDELEAKARRRDIIADEQTLFDYYDRIIPHDIYQTASFDKWYGREIKSNPQLLLMTASDILAREANEVTTTQFPDHLSINGVVLPLSYVFDPESERDGVTMTVPVPLLPQLPRERMGWLVPGLIEQRCIALVRNLPKAIRRNFVPVPDFIKAALETMEFAQGALYDALSQTLFRMTGVRVEVEAWLAAEALLDKHLRMTIEVMSVEGKVLGIGQDLEGLIARFSQQSQTILIKPERIKTIKPVDANAFVALPVTQQQKVLGMALTVYPALQEDKDGVKEGQFTTQDEANYHHRRALQRLLLEQLSETTKFLRQKLLVQTELGLYYRDLGRLDELVDDILLASIDSVVLEPLSVLPRQASELKKLSEQGRGEWCEQVEKLAQLVLGSLKLYHQLQKGLKGKIELAKATSLNDVKQQLAHLVYPHFVRDTPLEWLKQYPRYLKAIVLRLEKLAGQLPMDKVMCSELANCWQQYHVRLDKQLKEGRRDAALQLYRWMLEEYRVSLFAQQLGTKIPVSDKRLSKQWLQVLP